LTRRDPWKIIHTPPNTTNLIIIAQIKGDEEIAKAKAILNMNRWFSDSSAQTAPYPEGTLMFWCFNDRKTLHAYEEMYEGWTNRETWACYNHLTSDEYWKVTVLRTLITHSGPGDTLKEICDLWINKLFMGTITGGNSRGSYRQFWCSFLTDVGSLWRVDWEYVARRLLEEML
jgi:hypothetical protein